MLPERKARVKREARERKDGFYLRRCAPDTLQTQAQSLDVDRKLTQAVPSGRESETLNPGRKTPI
jgi:hypothetical protein